MRAFWRACRKEVSARGTGKALSRSLGLVRRAQELSKATLGGKVTGAEASVGQQELQDQRWSHGLCGWNDGRSSPLPAHTPKPSHEPLLTHSTLAATSDSDKQEWGRPALPKLDVAREALGKLANGL